MRFVSESKKADALFRLLPYLPAVIGEKIRGFAEENPSEVPFISEIRLRTTGFFSLTVGNRNVTRFGGRTYRCSTEEVAETLALLCEDSVHSFDETIREGYIFLSDGVRVGVCGRAYGEEGRTKAVSDITSLSIRLPHGIFGVCADILPVINRNNGIASALIYSPPGVGKTTVLRDLCKNLSGRRIALIDTRGELFLPDEMGDGLLDVLTGYTRAGGIEIATRTLSAEVIVCDEIGTEEEANAILSTAGCGVPILASAHAPDLSTLLQRPPIRRLHEAGLFRCYIGLERAEGSTRYSFSVFDACGEEKK